MFPPPIYFGMHGNVCAAFHSFYFRTSFLPPLTFQTFKKRKKTFQTVQTAKVSIFSQKPAGWTDGRGIVVRDFPRETLILKNEIPISHLPLPGKLRKASTFHFTAATTTTSAFL